MMVGAAVVPKFRGSAANGGYGEDKDKDLLGLQLQEERGVPLSLEEDRIPGRSQAVAPPAIQLSFPDVVPGGGEVVSGGGAAAPDGERDSEYTPSVAEGLVAEDEELVPDQVESGGGLLLVQKNRGCLWDENEGLIPDEYCARKVKVEGFRRNPGWVSSRNVGSGRRSCVGGPARK